jgi:hypothetical protein
LLLEFGFRAATAQVTIPNEVAAFFLEQNDRTKIYEVQLRLKDRIIANLEKQVATHQLVTVTYVKDASLYEELLQNKDDQNQMKDDQLEWANKEIRRQKFIKIIIVVGVIIEHILIISLL